MSKTGKIKKSIMIMAIILIPLVYSFFYLDAFWDPYSKLDKLPVAIVNQDAGAQINGKYKNAGQELVDELKNDNTLKWCFTDANESKNGLNNRKYYAAIFVTEDFSANIATANQADKKQGIIVYSPNEKSNYLAAQVLNRGILELKQKISGKVTQEIALNIITEVNKLPDSLGQLRDGLGQIADGSNTLRGKLGELNSNQMIFNNGLLQLNSGMYALNEGLNTADIGVNTAYGGAGQLKAGTSQMKDGLRSALTGSHELSGGLALMKSKLSGVIPLIDGSAKVYDGNTQLYQKFKDSASDIKRLNEGNTQFYAGLNNINNGVQQLYAKLPELKDGSKTISEGLTQYSQGINDLSNNLNQYVDGVNHLIAANSQASGLIQSYLASHPEAMSDKNIQNILAIYKQSGDKLSTLQQSGDPLMNGASALASKISPILEGSKNIASGTSDMYSKVGELTEGSKKAYESYAQIDGGIRQVVSSIEQAQAAAGLLAEGSKQVRDGINILNGDMNSGVQRLYQGSVDLYQGVGALYNGSIDVDDGTQQLKNGLRELDGGVQQLSDGAAQAYAGISELNKNASKFSDGEQQLMDGAAQLNEGANKALSGVAESLEEAKKQTTVLNGLDTYMSKPVEVQESKVNPVPDYGTAFAPYFMSLSLWVGGLLMFVGVFYDQQRRFKWSENRSKAPLRLFYFVVIGMAQAVLLAFAIQNGLHLNVKDTLLYYTLCCLVSISFVSIIHFLMIHMGDVGKFLTILLLILQLTSCGGTFPMELVPGFFNKLYLFMPMTYSVNTFREIISGVDYKFLDKNIAVLAVIAVVFITASMFISLKQQVNTHVDEKNGADVAEDGI